MKPEKPFGWVHMTDGKWEDFFLYKDGVGECEDCEYCIPLYTAPVRSSDISQERVDETAKDRHDWGLVTDDVLIEEVRRRGFTIRDAQISPKREWVGLTYEERFLNDARSEEEIEYAKAIEAKLKEKNT